MKWQYQNNAGRQVGQARQRGIHCTCLLMTVCLPLTPLTANADVRNDIQALRATRRIAIITPFFCSGPMQEPLPPRKDADSKDSKKDSKLVARVVLPDKSTPSARKPHSNKDLPPAAVKIERIEKREPTPKRSAPVPMYGPPAANASTPASIDAFYRDALKSLADVMGTSLPDRLTEGGRFTVVPASFVQQALHGLHWQPRDLFLPSGSDKAKFPTPNTGRIQQLARKLHVDAVFVGAMREPASIGDGLRLPFAMWRINPLDLGVKRSRAHVLSPRVRAFLVTAQGDIAWQDEQMADHPRTTPHTPRTLLVDWQEATEQAAQQLADSLHALSQNVPGESRIENKKEKG